MEAFIHLTSIWELARKEKRQDSQAVRSRRPLPHLSKRAHLSPGLSARCLCRRASCLPGSSLTLRAAPGHREHAPLGASLQYSDTHDSLYLSGAPSVPSTLPFPALTPSHSTTQCFSHFEAEKHSDTKRWVTHQPRQTSPRACLFSRPLTPLPRPPPNCGYSARRLAGKSSGETSMQAFLKRSGSRYDTLALGAAGSPAS